MCEFWMYSINLGVLIRKGGQEDRRKIGTALNIY